MPNKKTTKPKSKAVTREEPRLKVLVSSVVLGYEDLLESIYALLEQYGYEVVMSHKGTLREAVAGIQQRTGRSVAFPRNQLERAERPAYPLYALREGLVNAMAHRDYESSGVGVHVRIFPEHLTITNPGALPEGWKDSDLGRKHESRPGNPDIARVFYLRELMDQLGLGAQRIITECRDLGAKPPTWKAEKNTVNLTLFSAPALAAGPELSPRQQSFIKNLGIEGSFKASDYSSSAGVSERQARRDITELERLGLIERRGAGPSTVYRLRK